MQAVASGAAPTWQPPLVSDAKTLARMIDHTLLKPDAVEEQVRVLCTEGQEYEFASVCVHATWVPLCVQLLAGSDVMVCSVVGFPMGATLPAVKAYEVEQVAALGAQEVDMVMNVGRLRDGDYALVLRDIQAVVDAAHDNGLGAKVILETALLTDAEKIAACVICQAAGADFVKTATGFNGGGATVEDIALMRRVVGNKIGVKAAGGVRSAADALAMIAAGANRIGTSGGVKIVQEMAGVKLPEVVVGDY
ncbi:MAG: deoxyribose-phosphate aldolase [Anaerolineales bacterium]|nr:deoxyribose-phosphate aldolase [Anaerolineales bacterium]